MAIADSCRIHPTAVISVEAELGDGTEVGPYVVIDGPVKIGPGCILKPHVYLCGHVTMGRENVIFSGCVIGEQPQHLKYAGEPTRVEIGDNNIFRENVTIHRATTASWTTRIGSHNFLMAGSHVAHDCVIGNRCILANGALLGGHCQLDDNVIISGNSAVHQFVRLGRLSLLSGVSATTKDIPPFFIQQGHNTIVGVNIVGMKRAGMNNQQISAIRAAYSILLRKGLTLPKAIEQIDMELGGIHPVQELVTFLRVSATRGGINLTHSRIRNLAA